MSEFVEQCRREWRRLGVADPLADEMAADLTSDLEEAEAEGVSATEYLGASASDPRSFAASWASERGIIPTPPSREKDRAQAARPGRVHRPRSDHGDRRRGAARDRGAEGGPQDNQNSAASPSAPWDAAIRSLRHWPPGSGGRRCAGRVDPFGRRARRARLLCLAVVALEPLATTHCLASKSFFLVIGRRSLRALSPGSRRHRPRPAGACD